MNLWKSLFGTISRPGFPLALARPGESLQIVRFEKENHFLEHIQHLGFKIGQLLRVLRRQSGGLILQVNGQEVRLDLATARTLIVAPNASMAFDGKKSCAGGCGPCSGCGS